MVIDMLETIFNMGITLAMLYVGVQVILGIAVIIFTIWIIVQIAKMMK